MAKIKKDTSLRKSILQAAITGQLISDVEDSVENGKQLLDRIIEERNKKLLAEWEEKLKDNPKTKKPTQIVASEISEEEIPFEIPENWCWCRLGDLVPFGECENADPNEIEDEDWILDLEDIEKDSGRIIQFKKKKETESKSTKHIFREGNVLYSKLRPYLNKCVIAPKDGYCTSEIIPLDFGKFISNKYAQKFLMSPYFVDYTDSLSYGVKMPRLGTTDGKKALIPLPPLAVQNAIVAKLEEVLPLVDAYENAVLQKEELKTALPDKVKKAILQEAIQGKLTESWRKSQRLLSEVEAKQLLDRILDEHNAKLLADWEEKLKYNPKAKKPTPIVASEISEEEIPFEIPENWCWCRLGDVVKISTGNKDANHSSVEGKYDFFTCSMVPIKSNTFSYAGECLILPGNGANVGLVIYYDGQFEAYQRTYVLEKISNLIIFKYLFYVMNLNWKSYNDDKLFGSAIPYIKLGNLLEYPFPLPPLPEQEKIVEIIEQILPLCEKLGG